MAFTIGVDCDDVVLDLVENWIKLYNKDFNHNLKKESITDWSISKFVKRAAKKHIYSYIEKGEVFSTSKPVPNALETIQWLKELGHRVIYITANDPENVKFKWLLDNNFIDDIDDFVVAYDKSLILSDFLIDDRWENVKDRHGGILYSQPWNLKYEFENRVDNWQDFKEKFEKGLIP